MYHCPHCHKTSYLPASFATLQGFALVCGHCDSPFDTPDHTLSQTDDTTKGTCHIIACPSCLAEMSVSEKDYDVLVGHLLSCPHCHAGLCLPDKQEQAPATIPLLTKLALLYLLILASLALLYTPQGSAVIRYLASLSDVPCDLVISSHNLLQNCLIFVTGLF